MTPGEVIAGKYRLLHPIGATGEVWAVHDVRASRPFALELFPPAPERDVARSLLRTARGMNHPNLVRVHDAGEADGGQVFVVLDSFEGETLADRLAREGRLPELSAARIAFDVGRALCFIHRFSLFHGYLCPDNVFLCPKPGTEADVVKLVYFALGGMIAGRDAGPAPRKLAYRSPEHLEGTVWDGRADVWSLGVLLFEMLAGRLPFTEPSAPVPRIETVAPDVSPALGDAIALCLERDLDSRTSRVTVLMEALRRFASGKGVELDYKGPAAEVPRDAR